MTKTRQWTVLTAVAVLVVLVAGWLLLVKPQQSHASALRSQAQTQQDANAVLLSQIAQLQQEEKTLPQQQAALRKFTTQVPDNSAEPTLIRQLAAEANASNVDLVSMTPGAATLLTASSTAGTTSLTPTPTAGGQVYQLPIALSVTGTYPNLESFFLSLEKLPRALLVGSWGMCSGGTGGSAGGTCQAPTSPTGATLAPNVLGAALNAEVFYAPPASAVATTPAIGTTTPTTTGTTDTTTTPSVTTTTAPTPAPSSTSAS
jgi:Tfp pilus assembly protein PilO